MLLLKIEVCGARFDNYLVYTFLFSRNESVVQSAPFVFAHCLSFFEYLCSVFNVRSDMACNNFNNSQSYLLRKVCSSLLGANKGKFCIIFTQYHVAVKQQSVTCFYIL